MPRLTTIITWAVILIVGYAFLKNPTAFGHLVHKAGAMIGQAGNSLGAFVASI